VEEITIEAPAERVFDAFTNPSERVKWWGVVPETNGATHLRLAHSSLTTENARTSHRGWPEVMRLLQAYVERR
jgi:uncharacterized protein YndB with AHSA1/START domain